MPAVMDMYKTVGYGAGSAGKFIKHDIERNAAGPDDVDIDIKFCGICHSDIHAVDGDLGPPQFPLSPGHEVAGIVLKVGENVTHLKAGDQVAVGCMVESCLDCRQCKKGNENYCLGPGGFTGTYGDKIKYGMIKTGDGQTQGGYSERLTVHKQFAFKIPDSYPLDHAGPLCCAAITLYTPLKRADCLGGGKKVGIVGLGGLGMMGIKLAKAMGCKVIAISRNSDKREQAMNELKVDGFIARDTPEELFEHLNSFDVIINTASVNKEVTDLVSILDVGATLVYLGLQREPLPVVQMTLFREKNISGSLIGGCANTAEVINFCAEQDIKPLIELVTADQLDDVYAKMRKGASPGLMRHVLDIEASQGKLA